MNRPTPFRILSAATLILGITACGGTTEPAVETESVTEASKAPAAKPAYNPLAAEQQLIRDAEALQGILDKDAERKKQAVKDAN
jgi:hypothetical protein